MHSSFLSPDGNGIHEVLLQQALKPSLLFQQLQSLGVGSENSLHSWRLIRHDLWT